MEAREKSRGWEGHPAPENVDLAFKKVPRNQGMKGRGLGRRGELTSLVLHPQVDDGCPLWMWRGSVEVEATETELLHRLLRQPERWERNLHQASVVQTLSEDAEVFRCLLQDQAQALGSRPPQEQLLLR